MARDLFLFAALFYLIFTASAAAVLRARNSRFRWILAGTVALNNFFFLRFGLLFLHTMAPLRNLDGLVPLAIAAVNTGALLAVRSRLAEAPGLKRLLLSLAVLFLTLAAPLQFGAERSLLCWAAEIVLLLWFYARTRQPVYEIAAGLLALPAFNMACSLWFRIRCGAEPAIFRSSEFLTSLCMAAAFVYAAWFTGRKREIFVRARLLRYPVGNVCLILAAGCSSTAPSSPTSSAISRATHSSSRGCSAPSPSSPPCWAPCAGGSRSRNTPGSSSPTPHSPPVRFCSSPRPTPGNRCRLRCRGFRPPSWH